MSSLFRLLRRTFSTSAQSTVTTAGVATNLIKSLCKQVYKERSLQRVVEKFKISSENDRFRTKTSIYEDTIRRLATAGCFSSIEEILEYQRKYDDVSKEGFNARLISLYGKSGMFDHAMKMFDEMPDKNCKRTLLSFNALLAAGVNSKTYDKVDELFRTLPEKLEIEPDLVSYNTVIKAFCEMGSFDAGLSLLDEMEKKGPEPDLITFNILLNAFYAKGQFVDGERIWGQMLERKVFPDMVSYNAKLLGLALEKRSIAAGELYEEMKMVGVKPNLFSFNCLIQGSVNKGSLVEAKHWYGELMNSDFKANKITYGTLIPFAFEKDDLEFAFELSKHVFQKKRLVDESLLQNLVDRLVKESKIRQAKKLVKLSKLNNYCHYKLKLPLDE